MTADTTLGQNAPAALPAQPGTLAGALREYRAARGLSQRRADRLVGSHGGWGKWECGVIPSPVYLVRLADLLGVPASSVRRLAGPDRVRRPESIGEEQSHALARARLAAGLSAAEFARRMHVSASLVSRWESGERLPASCHFPAIAEVIGVDVDVVDDLFGRTVARGETVPVPSLRGARERRQLNRATLASLLGVNITTVQRWERTGRAPYRQALTAAEVLGIDLATLARPAIVWPRTPKPVSQLLRLRMRRQLSAGVVAARAGFAPSLLRAWERGNSRPSWAQARALARVLKTPVSDVFAAAGLDPPRYLDPARWSPAHVPEILAELRRWNGWTQYDLACLAGVSISAVRAWEQGRHRPRAATLHRLDDQLNASGRFSSLHARCTPRGGYTGASSRPLSASVVPVMA